MKRKAFISGPIQGMETRQSYRDVIREICIARAFVLEDAHYERIDHSFFVVRNHFVNVQNGGNGKQRIDV